MRSSRRQNLCLAVMVVASVVLSPSSCFTVDAFTSRITTPRLPIAVLADKGFSYRTPYTSSVGYGLFLSATEDASSAEAAGPVVIDEDSDDPRGQLAASLEDEPAAAQALLAKISSMREQQASQQEINNFLDNLLETGPDSSLPFWTRSKRLAKYSRRARLASLRRTLDMTTPPPSENSSNDKEESQESQQQRRRRALTSLLRSIASGDVAPETRPIILAVEKNARMAMIGDASDLRKRIPEGLETPQYETLAQKGSVEIRRYKPYSVCAVSMNKPRPQDASKTDAKVQMPEMGGASSFGALAGYLFGKNKQSTAMKMTTPVFTAPTADTGETQMQFVLPSQYWDDESVAPQPLDGSGVNLIRQKEEIRAVAMFGGYASKKEVDRRKKELLEGLSQNKDWKAVNEQVATAQYNDPFTVPWKRLNEVSVAVEPRTR